MAWQHVGKLQRSRLRPDLLRGHCHAQSCGAVMTVQKETKNDLDICIRFPSGYWRLKKDFRAVTVSPSPHLLLSRKATLEKADCRRFDCWPDPWRGLCWLEPSITCGFRTCRVILWCCWVPPMHLAVMPVTGYSGIVIKTSASCCQFPNTLLSGVWPRSAVVGQVIQYSGNIQHTMDLSGNAFNV